MRIKTENLPTTVAFHSATCQHTHKGQMGHIHGQKQMMKHTRSSAPIALKNLARRRQEQYQKGMAKKSSGCEVFRFSYEAQSRVALLVAAAISLCSKNLKINIPKFRVALANILL